MDLSMMSTDDLKALQSGDLSKVSTAGLKQLASMAQEKPGRNVGGVGDLFAGAIRGAGSIGATLLTPVDALVRATGADNSVFGPNGSVLGRSDRREAMTDSLRSMGADTNSYAFGAGKFGAEVAGTLGAGGALGKVAQAFGAAPKVVQALTSSGMTTGGPAAAGLAPRVTDALLRSGSGAVTGATAAGMVDPESALLGAGIGAALPPAVRALGAAGTAIGKGASTVKATVSDSAATNAAIQRILAATGGAKDLSSQIADKFGGIPVTAAARAASPELATLEQASRLRTPEAWRAFDDAQAAAVWEKVQQAGSAAEQLDKVRGIRSDNWKDAWNRAASAFVPGQTTTPGQLKAALGWKSDVQKFSEKIDQALQSAPAANDTVAAMLRNIRGKLDTFGENFSPAHLQQIRADLSGKAWAMSADPLKQVPRDNPATVSVLRAVDDILNKATDGQWYRVPKGYAQDSAAVDAARGAGRLMSNFVSPEGNLLGRTTAGGALPDITAARLERALNLARDKSGSITLDAKAQLAVKDAIDALKAQQIVQQVKRSATAGGGSDTASNIMALAGTSRPGILKELMQMGREAATGRTDRALAGLLSSPDDLAIALMPLIDQPAGLLSLAPQFAVRAAPGAAAGR